MLGLWLGLHVSKVCFICVEFRIVVVFLTSLPFCNLPITPVLGCLVNSNSEALRALRWSAPLGRGWGGRDSLPTFRRHVADLDRAGP